MKESIQIRQELAARGIEIESVASTAEESAEFSSFIRSLGNNGR